MSWYLNAALTTMRGEVNDRYPSRDKASDGTVGDEAHQETSSDHNPDPDGSVDAWDMDVNLNGAGFGVPSSDLEWLKDCFEKHEASKYWIHDRVIASRSTGWKRESYGGSNPHDKHIHWNTRSEYEDSTKPWGIENMAITNADANLIVDVLLARIVPSGTLGDRAVSDWLKGGHLAVRDLGATDDKVDALKVTTDATATQVAGIAASLAGADGDPDLAAIQAMLDTQTDAVDQNTRHSLADFGDGGADAVRPGPEA